MESKRWLIWQLVDSAFPGGGLAHSGGLEAAWKGGAVADALGLAEFVKAALLQAGRSALPLVAASCRVPKDLPALDRLAEAMLTNHVANRASRLQGQSFLMAAERIFAAQGVTAVRATLRSEGLLGHLPPVFGAVLHYLGLAPAEAAELFMYLALRGLVSAAVRLGMVGPLEAQAIQHRLSPEAERLARRFAAVPPQDAAGASPVIDVFQGMADRLYSRLFQS